LGWYERWVLPRLLDVAMRQRRFAAYRRRVVAAARGRVLEIGIGSGLNLPLYGAAVERVYGIDLSPPLLARAQARGRRGMPPLLLLRAAAERLPLAAASIDTVVMTWTLCSVADPSAALDEVRRVLRPGGRLLFVEHGLAPEPRIERWQRRLTPCWKRVGGNCHLDRRTDALLRAAGFEIGELHTGYMKGPKPFTFMYEGSATPAA
jgi:ubiquinone/menaquinone biosynthesis C-methylase UbiE